MAPRRKKDTAASGYVVSRDFENLWSHRLGSRLAIPSEVTFQRMRRLIIIRLRGSRPVLNHTGLRAVTRVSTSRIVRTRVGHWPQCRSRLTRDH